MISLDRPFAKYVLAGVLCIMAVLCFYASKWNFANAASARTDVPEAALALGYVSPDDPQTHYASAVLLGRQFDADSTQRSIDEYKLSAEMSPNNYLIWMALARAYDLNGDTELAGAAYEKALDLAPNYADVRWALGNHNLRSGSNDTDAFRMIASAVSARPGYAGPAVMVAMQASNGDPGRARSLIGNTPTINAALAQYLITEKRLDQAFAVWNELPSELRSSEYKGIGEALVGDAVSEKRYRIAAQASGDIGIDPKPVVGAITNGGFESAVKPEGSGTFDWHIPAGSDPQISLSDNSHSGHASLWFIFNSARASDFRSVDQLTAVEPGARYRLTMFYRSQLRTDAGIRFEIVNLAGKPIGTTPQFGLNAEWLPIEASFTAPSDVDAVRVRLVHDDCKKGSDCSIAGKLWLDDISLVKDQ